MNNNISTSTRTDDTPDHQVGPIVHTGGKIARPHNALTKKINNVVSYLVKNNKNN